MIAKFIFISLFGILAVQSAAAQDIPEDLLGVWQSEGNPRVRFEIQSDGIMTTWMVKGASYGLGTKLHLRDTQTLRITADDQFQIGDSEPAIQYHYEATPFRLHFGPQADPKLVFKFKRVTFGEERTGSYELHRNQAFEDRVRKALEAKDLDSVRELLRSPAANFLRMPDSEASNKAGKSVIRNDIWAQALKTRDPESITLIYKQFPEAFNPSHLANAVATKDQAMIELLTQLTQSKVPELSQIEQRQLDSLLRVHQFLSLELTRRETEYSFGCGRQQGGAMSNETAAPELVAERRKFSEEFWKNDAADPTYRERFMEAEFARCLQLGNNGPFDRKLLSAISVKDDATFGRPVFTTPLYFYGSLRWGGRNSNDRMNQAAKIKYAIINALLDAGANPTVKPSPNRESFAALLYKTVNHTAFRNALKPRSDWERAEDYAPIIAKIDSFNRIMRKIGGPEYDATREPNDVYAELSASSDANLKIKPETAGAAEELVQKKPTELIPVASPVTAPKPAIQTPSSMPAETSQVARVAASPAAIIGCWKWSNGMRIEVQESGSASNGFALGSWDVKGKQRYTIAWPDFTGKVSLSANGRSLSSVDSIGTSSTAARLQGDLSSFVGSWRWDNGGIVTIASDGVMSVGPIKGTWSGSGKSYNTAWPIIDVISVGADGKNLSGQNQFGSFTATKMPGC